MVDDGQISEWLVNQTLFVFIKKRTNKTINFYSNRLNSKRDFQFISFPSLRSIGQIERKTPNAFVISLTLPCVKKGKKKTGKFSVCVSFDSIITIPRTLPFVRLLWSSIELFFFLFPRCDAHPLRFDIIPRRTNTADAIHEMRKTNGKNHALRGSFESLFLLVHFFLFFFHFSKRFFDVYSMLDEHLQHRRKFIIVLHCS